MTRELTAEQKVEILTAKLRLAYDLLAELGWYPFGYHSDLSPVPDVVFSTQIGDDGLPEFERLA